MLKSKVPNRWEWAHTVGVEFDCLSRFNVSSTWGSNLSNNLVGEDGSSPVNI